MLMVNNFLWSENEVGSVIELNTFQVMCGAVKQALRQDYKAHN
jgi:hypothetical protein